MKKFITLALIIALTTLTGCTNSQKDLVKDITGDLFAEVLNKNNKKDTDITVDTSVEDLLAEVEIEEPKESNYNRDDYTSSYQKYEYNGEEYTSIRSYAYYASAWYNDETEEFYDVYNGETYKGNVLRSLDYDHIIPLHYANLHGADEWSAEKKKEYADDPTVGINVNAHDNRAKGDKGPCEWLPEENVEDYCYTWLVLAVKWNLSMDQDCIDTIKAHLDGVPASELQIINPYK